MLSSTPSPSLTSQMRGFFYLLISAVLVLLLAGIGGLIWIAAQSPLSVLATRGGNPAAAMFVPKQSPLIVSLLANPDRLRSFSLAAARPIARRRVRATFDRLEQNILGKTGLNYDQDIKPWLGNEITFAVMAADYDRNSENGQQPGYLLALDSQDEERSRQFLQLFWQKRALDGIDLVFEQYAGVKIIYGSEVKSEDGDIASQPLRERQKQPRDLAPALATAVVGDRLLFANHPKVLRDAINNVQAPELSLSSTAAYQQALRDLPDRQIGLSFLNLPQLAQWLGSETSAAPATLAAQPRLYENLVVTLLLDRLGLIANTTLLAASGQTLPAAKPQLSQPVGALRFVPASSPLAAAGIDLPQFWSQSEGTAGYGKLANLVEQFQIDLQTRWGLERSDLFDWVQGEFALALLPEKRAKAEWIFVAQKSSDSAKQIARFNTIAQQQGLSIGSLTLADQTVSVWTKLLAATPNKEAVDLKTEVAGVHALVNDYEIFATSIEAMAQALKASENSLTASEPFRQTIAPLAQPNDGYLYIDWQTVRQLAQQIPIGRLAEVAAKPLLGNVRSFTLTSYGSSLDARRGAVFIRLDDT